MPKSRAALAALAALSVLACNPDDVVHRIGWFATMRHQRSIKPYARPLAPVPGTVPVTGAEPLMSLQTADRLANPRTRTSESINHGRFLYETYCLVCHGQAGRGDGLMPVYGDKVRGVDRWDLVNYVRTLQAGAKSPTGRR